MSMAPVRAMPEASAHSGARKWKFLMFSLKVLTFLWIASGATLPIFTSPLCWMNIVSQVKLPWIIGGFDILVDRIRCHTPNLYQPVVLDEYCVTGQVAMDY